MNTKTISPTIQPERMLNREKNSWRLLSRKAWLSKVTELDLKGAEGEALATDVVIDGPLDASKMLIVISGVHGVEGFTGSAVQTGLLGLNLSKPDDTSILYVHAINPFGFSHLRRVTQENV